MTAVNRGVQGDCFGEMTLVTRCKVRKRAERGREREREQRRERGEESEGGRAREGGGSERVGKRVKRKGRETARVIGLGGGLGEERGGGGRGTGRERRTDGEHIYLGFPRPIY